jgi:hypothetical protein
VVITPDFEGAAIEAGYMYDVGDAQGVCLHYPDSPSNFVVIFNDESISPGNVAHESYHLTAKIMRHVGITYIHDNHEAFAYLIGFIVDGFHKIIEEYDSYKDVDSGSDSPCNSSCSDSSDSKP